MAIISRFLAAFICIVTPLTAAGQPPAEAEFRQSIERLSTPRDQEVSERQRDARRLERGISRFIVRQLEMNPSIAQCDLQHNLRKLFEAENPNECQAGEASDRGTAQVFTTLPRNWPRQVVVTYELYLGCMGPGCTVPVFENYMCANGKAQRTAHLDSILNGYTTTRELLTWYADKKKFWILMQSMMTGSSGRLLGRQAMILQIGADSIKAIWRTPTLADLYAHVNRYGDRWEVDYVDASLYPNGPDKQVIDIYQLNYRAQTFRRIIHYREK